MNFIVNTKFYTPENTINPAISGFSKREKDILTKMKKSRPCFRGLKPKQGQDKTFIFYADFQLDP
jgi:hypothetical protein